MRFSTPSHEAQQGTRHEMNDRKDGKRVLVAYYSLTGSTARVARDLAARLNACDSSIPPGRTR